MAWKLPGSHGHNKYYTPNSILTRKLSRQLQRPALQAPLLLQPAHMMASSQLGINGLKFYRRACQFIRPLVVIQGLQPLMYDVSSAPAQASGAPCHLPKCSQALCSLDV